MYANPGLNVGMTTHFALKVRRLFADDTPVEEAHHRLSERREGTRE
jgi:hypothetical protein